MQPTVLIDSILEQLNDIHQDLNNLGETRYQEQLQNIESLTQKLSDLSDSISMQDELPLNEFTIEVPWDSQYKYRFKEIIPINMETTLISHSSAKHYQVTLTFASEVEMMPKWGLQ